MNDNDVLVGSGRDGLVQCWDVRNMEQTKFSFQDRAVTSIGRIGSMSQGHTQRLIISGTGFSSWRQAKYRKGGHYAADFLRRPQVLEVYRPKSALFKGLRGTFKLMQLQVITLPSYAILGALWPC